MYKFKITKILGTSKLSNTAKKYLYQAKSLNYLSKRKPGITFTFVTSSHATEFIDLTALHMRA